MKTFLHHEDLDNGFITVEGGLKEVLEESADNNFKAIIEKHWWGKALFSNKKLPESPFNISKYLQEADGMVYATKVHHHGDVSSFDFVGSGPLKLNG